MFDLIVRNASLVDGRSGIDVGVRDGRIVALETALSAAPGTVGEVLEADGLLLSPPFVDAHFHMDSTLS